jgi:hypothetical protein
VNVPELSDKSLFVSDIVVEVTGLPEWGVSDRPLSLSSGLKRHLRFQQLNGAPEQVVIRLAEQQMNVLRHDHISENMKCEAKAHIFERTKKCLLHPHSSQERLTMVAAECEKVALT